MVNKKYVDLLWLNFFEKVSRFYKIELGHDFRDKIFIEEISSSMVPS